jgi:hypothetical protein
MKRTLAGLLGALCLVATAGRGQIITIPLSLEGTGVFVWENAVWWTNSPVPTNVQSWQAWWAVNTNFATIEGKFAQAIGTDIPGMISDALSGSGFLTGNQTIELSGDATGSGATAIEVTVTNIHPPVSGSVGQVLTKTAGGWCPSNAPATLANSPRALAWSTNLLYVAAGTTNVIGWITNYAGSSVTSTNSATNLTSGTIYIVGNPMVLGATDGTNYFEASGLATNVPMRLAVTANPSSAGLNPPVPVPTDAWLTNFTLYNLSLPGTFGQSNSLFGQHLYVSDPISGTEAANKQYVDGLFGNTAWWSAQNDVQLNGLALNLDNSWTEKVSYPTTNAGLRQVQFHGVNQMQLTCLQPTLVGTITNVWLTQSTNVSVLVATNGFTSAPMLQGSHYLSPLNWYFVGTISNSYPNLVTNGSTWGYLIRFTRPFLDRFYVRSCIANTNLSTGTFAGNLAAAGSVQATNGAWIGSNSWMAVPTLASGDNFYCSSNGVPHVIWRNQVGTLYTNRLVP